MNEEPKVELTSDEWAEARARGKAAFVRYDIEKNNRIPFSRGKAVMYCLVCEALLVSERTIRDHAKRCRVK